MPSFWVSGARGPVFIIKIPYPLFLNEVWLLRGTLRGFLRGKLLALGRVEVIFGCGNRRILIGVGYVIGWKEVMMELCRYFIFG